MLMHVLEVEFCLTLFMLQNVLATTSLCMTEMNFTLIYSFFLGKHFILVRAAVDLGAYPGNTAWGYHLVFTPRGNL